MTEQELLKQLEKRLKKEYKDTEAVISEKIAYFTKDFDKDNKLYQQRLKNGEITKQEYRRWYKDQMFNKKWANNMASVIAQDLTDINVTASNIINNDLSQMFMFGCLEASDELKDYSPFDVFDTKQIKQIADNSKRNLPKSRVKIPKDKKWNERRIRSSLMQSAIKGESVRQLASRLKVVVGMNQTSAIRNARTMMTASHNMGKLELGQEANEMGIDVRKQWIATFDNRTRDSHAYLHEEVVDMNEEFSNGLMFPGDPDGDPSEVYNCRCTMVLVHKDKQSGMSKEEFEENVAENEQRKAEFKQANQDLKNGGSQPQPTPPPPQTATKQIPPTKMTNELEANNVEFNPPAMHTKIPTTEEIVNRLGGADQTQGSCASLGFAFIGNAQGYDVLDFRGGKSLQSISRGAYVREMLEKHGGSTFTHLNAFKAVEQALGTVAEGKQYYLACGAHASIIRKIGDAFEYLELQSATNNGWHTLNNEALRWRFGCKRSRSSYGTKLLQSAEICDIDGFKGSNEFEKLLGYINTASDKQMKGAGGGIK